ncbi:MAG: cysteine desulfurase [Proteobacteria bacterium]|jgi:cysteine desulfurase|nr:cysteine desulfurase [Pseudomonadota bacterium]
MPDPIYLDNNATTPIFGDVLQAMLPWLTKGFGNPSSGHIFGERARNAIVQARQEVADLLNCQAEEVVFTSGGTEANNLAIRGLLAALTGHPSLVTTALEHPATIRPCQLLERMGHKITQVRVDETGLVKPSDVEAALDSAPALVSVMHANNETGTIQPISEISALAKQRGAYIHTDAAQSVGKVPIDVGQLGIHLLSIAGHKLGAPKGVGALYIKSQTPIKPVLLGGGQEGGIRPGTENTPYIVGLGEACRLARQTMNQTEQRLRDLRDRLHHLLEGGIDGLKLNGHPMQRLPNTLNVRFPGVRGSQMLARTTEVAASTGSACHESGESPSPVLLAMGLEPEEALQSVRLSVGRQTTEAEVDGAAKALIASWRALRC